MVDFKYEYDAEKSDRNLRARGFDFDDAARIFDGPVLESKDTRRDYGETRLIAIGVVQDVEITLVYTWRGKIRRIISARRSKQDERRKYREAIARNGPKG